jgi:hypothetical protein
MVELLIDGSWVDITQRVMVRDSNGQISITRGQTAEGQNPSPGSCSLELNNRDGLFSPGNPLSPWYGKFGRNTQIRVSVMKGDDKSYRFWGEVTGWPEDWDTTGEDVWVDVEAAGILQRLSQGNTPLRSTMYRGLMSAATPTPVAYWPCEDGASATSLASALGGPAMALRGSPTLSSDTGFLCSSAFPVMNGASLVGTVPSYTVTGQSQVRFLMYLPTSPPDGTQLIKVGTSGGTIPFWAIAYGTGGSLTLKGLDTDGLTVLVNSGAITFAVDGHRIRVSMELTQQGADVAWNLGVVNASDASGTGFSGTFTSQTVGKITSVTVCPGQTITTGVFGHISVQNQVTSGTDIAGSVDAFVGESPSIRFGRLCLEQGINYVHIAGAASTDAMGPQLPNTFLALLQECVDVDQGVYFERETAFGLAYRNRSELYNQPAQLTLSYGAHQLSAVPKPVPDDQKVRNQITATRPNGSSATAELDTGALSTQDPPRGVGVYPDDPSLNVKLDSDLPDHAAWRLHLGTVDEPRYPAISVNLAHSSMAGSQRIDALNVLFGTRIVVASPPSRLGGDISQIVIGIQETITHFEHRITFVCQPASPFEVFVLDDPVRGKLTSDGSVLAQDMTPTQTSVQVAVTAGPLWTIAAGDFPFDVAVAGERMTVTNITGTSSPQTFTVTRSVNGVVKAHAANEPINLASPAALAL